MSKKLDELEDAMTLAVAAYVRAVAEAKVEAISGDAAPADPVPTKKSSSEMRKAAAEKVDPSKKSKGAKAAAPVEDEDAEDEDADESDDDENEEEDEDAESEEPSEQDVKDAVREALRVLERDVVIGAMKKAAKVDKASLVKPEKRQAVLDAISALMDAVDTESDDEEEEEEEAPAKSKKGRAKK